ncbi:MAG: outer membrane lipoprotein-sorting protein [Betaproteobacteria bacterium]
MSRLISFVVVALLSGPAAAVDVQALLKTADRYRLPAQALMVETEVKLFKANNLDKERRYTVYVKPGRRSLVVMQSPSEKGQKVLMLGEEFWQIMPQSQRPIRITPMQKLLGDASVGDIATMNWGEDYTGTVVAEENIGGTTCLHLSLTAQVRGMSYQRIELYLAKADLRPVQAGLYVASDKLAKRATFTVEDVAGRPQVAEMILVDEIQAGRRTVIRYLKRQARSIPDEFYNPMFLTRNDLKE